MSRKADQRGSVTLETTIILPFFILMFLLIFGLFSVVSAQNQISHAFIQSSKSMSLDCYFLEKVESAGESTTTFWGELSDMVLDIVRLNNDEHYTARTDWYNNNAQGANVFKKRFVGYLSGGNADEADELLKNLGVVGGLDGIEIEVAVSDEIMTIKIQYTLRFVFDAFDMGKIPMEQTMKTKLWK